MEKLHVSWFDFDACVKQAQDLIINSKTKNSVHLVGIARGSFTLLHSLSNRLDLDYSILQYSTYDSNSTEVTLGFHRDNKIPDLDSVIWVVDDICDTGNSMKKVIEFLKDKGYNNINVYTMVGDKKHNYNYSIEHNNTWTVFPWETEPDNTCNTCVHSEPCNKYKGKVHCNLHNKSFNPKLICLNYTEHSSILV